MSIDEVKQEPIDQHDDYPVMPKITSTTSLVESGIQIDELEPDQEEDNLEISTVYDCPICSKKYLTLEIAEKHIEVYHKIPTEMQYVLGLKIQATTLQKIKIFKKLVKSFIVVASTFRTFFISIVD